MTSRIIVNNIQSDTGVSTVTIESPVALSGGITGTGFAVGTGASISSPAINVLTISTNNVERIRVGAAGSIGIGTDNPTKFIDISGVHSGINTTGRFVINPHSAGWDTGVTSGSIHHHYADNFRLYSGQIGSGTERFKVDNSGRVTKPSQPVFKAYRSASTSGAGVIVFNTEIYDVGNNYNNSNGLFTAPVAGYYIFFFLSIGSGASNTWRDVWGSVNGTTTPSSFGARPTNQTTDYSSSAAATNIVYLNANDTFGLYASGSLYSDANFWLQFGGYLLG
jgi:hypothetical protein